VYCGGIDEYRLRNLHRCQSLAEAQQVVSAYQIDLIVMENLLPGEDVYDFIQKLRRSEGDDNRFAPTVLLSAHTGASIVSKARDSGANFLIGKPISPKVLLERILWVAREKRQFLETDSFVGSDRRAAIEDAEAGPAPARNAGVGRRRGSAAAGGLRATIFARVQRPTSPDQGAGPASAAASSGSRRHRARSPTGRRSRGSSRTA
jgi:CheY-like chemotaxis protein